VADELVMMMNGFDTNFDEYRTGKSLTPDTFTDTVIFGQAERSILEVRFQFPGRCMFHAHKTEFAELGWMGLFDVVDEAGVE